MKVTIFCGCYIIGGCVLWADFGSQHYWLWVTPDARVGWAMSSERTELMSVPWGGCLSFWPGNCVKTHNLQTPSESELSSRLHVHQRALNDPVQLWDFVSWAAAVLSETQKKSASTLITGCFSTFQQMNRFFSEQRRDDTSHSRAPSCILR